MDKNNNQPTVENVKDLFRYIKELNDYQSETRVTHQKFYLFLEQIHYDPVNIKINYYSNSDDEANDIFLSVHKPDYVALPEPEEIFAAWLQEGWKNYKEEANFVSGREIKRLQAENQKSEADYNKARQQVLFENNDEATGDVIENFNDNKERVHAYMTWLEQRKKWVIYNKTNALFQNLYEIYRDMKKDSESVELIAASGMLRSAVDSAIEHPVLTHRVRIEYDAKHNDMLVRDTEASTEIYTELFKNIDNINHTAIVELYDILHDNEYHPLEKDKRLVDFYQMFVHRLSPDSHFISGSIPKNWRDADKFIISYEPCIILRTRLNRVANAVDQIIRDIDETQSIPAPIAAFINGGKMAPLDICYNESIEEQLAAVGGESADILLSKEANREQLEIAQHIENCDAVLVQGPPGTGKTHTIANLLGHFLAQGKTVLVTSETDKALKVLKSKVTLGLQDLCVAVLGDSSDMGKSVDCITSHMSDSLISLRKRVDELGTVRQKIMAELADTRKKIFAGLHREVESLVYDGEGFSPETAAKFINSNASRLNFIPGNITSGIGLPLSMENLKLLYKSNTEITFEEESELAVDLPATDDIMRPEDFDLAVSKLQSINENIIGVGEKQNWQVTIDDFANIEIDGSFGTIKVSEDDNLDLHRLIDATKVTLPAETWVYAAIADGKAGEGYLDRWNKLIEAIDNAGACLQKTLVDGFGKDVVIHQDADYDELERNFQHLRDIFIQKGKLSFIDKIFHSEYKRSLACILIDGKEAASADDCNIILEALQLNKLRRIWGKYWNELMAAHGAPDFAVLMEEAKEPERQGEKYIALIQQCLKWKDMEGDIDIDLNSVGTTFSEIAGIEPLDSDEVSVRKELDAIDKVICPLSRCLESRNEALAIINALNVNKEYVVAGEQMGSRICAELLTAQEHRNMEKYNQAYKWLLTINEKRPIYTKRKALLKELSVTAPDWAVAISNRIGIHGQNALPDNVAEAWKWKQLSGLLDELYELPVDELQKKVCS